MTAPAHVALNRCQLLDPPGNEVRILGRRVAHLEVGDRLLGRATVLTHPARVDAQVPTQPVVGARTVIGQHPCQVTCQVGVGPRARHRPVGQPLLLCPQQVEPALQQPPRIAEVDLLLLGQVTASTKLVAIKIAHPVDETWGEDQVDRTAPTLVRLRGHTWPSVSARRS